MRIYHPLSLSLLLPTSYRSRVIAQQRPVVYFFFFFCFTRPTKVRNLRSNLIQIKSQVIKSIARDFRKKKRNVNREAQRFGFWWNWEHEREQQLCIGQVSRVRRVSILHRQKPPDKASYGPSSTGFRAARTRTDRLVCGEQGACVPWLGSIIRMRVISRLREVRELILALPLATCALDYILLSQQI